MGIPLRMLLDKREPFFPYSLAAFFWKLPLCTLLYYKECEQIWQAVGEATWVELVAYKDALAQYNAQRDAQLRQQSSWNILSSDMWIAWREQWATRSRAGSDRNKIIQDTGIGEWRIELVPLLKRTRIAPLTFKRVICYSILSSSALDPRSIYQGIQLSPPRARPAASPIRRPQRALAERDRRALMFGSKPSAASAPTRSGFFPELRVPKTGAFTQDELRHLRKRGIRLEGIEDFELEFENTVDARAMIIPDDSEIVGVPALLPPSSGGSGHPRPCHRAPAARMEGKRVVPV
ncbi:BQ5605_C009g05448 [Microbotryum silenes-dioicae]|uniref:BQ5605_C009g05448 protein n=1 Tax=Microbotryum silenes-dioicae TaxID=796604 RepID=A0A2X0N6Z7_9BASI|nr:BQ5605_C009g05448 [Microbotryum silenes-dioicae]